MFLSVQIRNYPFLLYCIRSLLISTISFSLALQTKESIMSSMARTDMRCVFVPIPQKPASTNKVLVVSDTLCCPVSWQRVSQSLQSACFVFVIRFATQFRGSAFLRAFSRLALSVRCVAWMVRAFSRLALSVTSHEVALSPVHVAIYVGRIDSSSANCSFKVVLIAFCASVAAVRR